MTGHQTPPRAGFALVVTLMLMAFIVLLMLSLSSLVTLETLASKTGRDQDQARQNALLGLKIALGELEQVAGADQRVTARSDITGGSLANTHWTGVWESIPPVTWNDLRPVPPQNAHLSTNNHVAPSNLRFLNWLVSGNEPKDADGASLLAFDPTQSLSADFGESLTTPAVYLVAGGTLVEPSAATPAGLEGVVSAPKVAVNDSSGQIHGHYAWWVGDEGVKARVQPKSSSPPSILGGNTDLAAQAAFQLPSAADPSAINGLELFDSANDSLQRLITHANLPLASDDNSMRLAFNQHWHDLSLVSSGLLTDTRWGGFRGDLSHAFENDAVFNRYFNRTHPAASRAYYFVNPTQLGYSSFFSNWAILRDYYLTRPEGDGSITMDRVAASDGDRNGPYARPAGRPWINSPDASSERYHRNSPAHPVLARLQISVGVSFEEVDIPIYGEDGIRIGTRSAYSPVLLIKPMTGFYNPYNVTIDPTSNIHLRWGFLPLVTIQVGDNEPVQFRLREVLSQRGRRPAIQDLRIQHPKVPFEPGETRLFTLSSDITRANLAGGQTGEIRETHFRAGPIGASFDYENEGFLKLPLWSAYEATEVGPNEELPNTSNPESPPPPSFGLTPEEKLAMVADSPDTNVTISIDTNLMAGLWVMFLARRPPINVAQTGSGSDHVQYFSGYAETETIAENAVSSTRSFSVGSALPSSVSPNGDQSIILSWGLWFRGANEQNAQTRLLVDSNFRALTGPRNYDRLGDEFYLSSIFTGDEYFTNYGHFLTDDFLPDIVADYDRFSAYWGGGTTMANGAERVVLFDIPRAPLTSLGAFQHANLGRYANDPTYIVGNSFVPSRLPNVETAYHRFPGTPNHDIWDLSWLVNQQLWDSYYFSGLPHDLDADQAGELISGQRLSLNHRLRPLGETLDGASLQDLVTDTSPSSNSFYEILSHFVLDGAFNINSTSTEAWRAVLSSARNLRLPVYRLHEEGPAGTLHGYREEERAVFSRLIHPMGQAFEDGNPENFWVGYRALDEDEIASLADAIVHEIKAEGRPFASLADFINRPLSGPMAGEPGLLQRAITRAGLNSSIPGSPITTTSFPEGVVRDPYQGASQATGFPGYLTQADILQSLGPVLTARSDTFTIRSYGDVVNPLSGRVVARAWCEAVVQRIPRSTTDRGDPLSRDAQRQFRVIDFRWLQKEDV